MNTEKFQTKTLLFADDDDVIWVSKAKMKLTTNCHNPTITNIIKKLDIPKLNINIQKPNYHLLSLRKKPLPIILKLGGDLLIETHKAK